MANEPLGTRINNPLNIRSTTDKWVGKTGEEMGFVSFKRPEYGYRAADRTLTTYGTKGVSTVAETISRFAPKADKNDTEGYIDFVSKRTGIDPNAEIDLSDASTRRTLISAMAKMETGTDITPEEVDQMVSSAEARAGRAEATPVEGPAMFATDRGTEDIINIFKAPGAYARENPERHALELTTIQSALNPDTRLDQAYAASLDMMKNAYDPESIVEAHRQAYAEEKAGLVTQGLVNFVAGGEMSPEDAASIVKNLGEMRETYSGQKGQERIFAESVAPPTADEHMVNLEVAKNTEWAVYKNWADEVGGWDTFKNYLGLFFSPDTLKDASDLVDGNYFKGKKDLLRFIANYNALDPSTRPEVFEEIFPEIVEAYDGNHIKIAGLINTMQSVDPDTELTLSALMDTVDIATSATLATGIGVVRGAVKGANNVRKAKRLDNDLKAAAMENIDEASSDKLTRAINSSPFDMDEQLPFYEATDGISKEKLAIASRIKQNIDETVRSPVRNIGSRDFMVQSKPLTGAEKTSTADEYIANLAARAEERDVVFEQVEPVSFTEDGFTVKYKWDKGRVTETRTWKDSDIGTFVEEGEDFKKNGALKTVLRSILSPEQVLNNVSQNLVQKLTNAGLQADRVKNNLVKVQRTLNDGMSRSEIEGVGELLVAGDEAEKIFKLDDLLTGNIQLKSGQRPYSLKEAENYYKKVAFSQELWKFRNHTVRKELDFIGAKHINMVDYDVDAVVDVLGVPKQNMGAAIGNLKNETKVLIPQATEGQRMARAGDLDAARLQEEGYELFSLVHPYKSGKSEPVEWMLVRNEGKDGDFNVKELPDIVLNQVPGYVPRIYEPGYHFVKDLDTGDTIRAFENQSDATKYIEELTAVNDGKRYDVIADRDFTQFQSVVEDANAYGGLFTGARKKTAPLMLQRADGRLTRPDRMSYGDAMEKYINNISNEMALGPYKLALKERWVNTVNAIAKAEPGGKPFGIDPRADWRIAPVTITDKAMKAQMEYTRDYLIKQFRIQTNEERTWESIMRGIAAVSEGKAGKIGNYTARNAMKLGSKDPISSLRAATFYAHLGWFNVRQLYVQAQNSSLAIAMHPVHGMSAATDMLPMRALLNVPEETLLKIKAENTMGLGKYVDEVIDFNRSGLKDSILRDANFDAVQKGLGSGTKSMFRQLAQKGLVFYENGEVVSRLIAWNIAKRRKGYTGKKLNDDQIDEVLEETFRLHMNLQRENAAKWQSNWLAVPTQFLQVQAKFMENMLTGLSGKGKWSREEAASVFAGQILLYGTVGVPLAEEFTEWAIDRMGITPEELQANHPGLAEMVADGANGWLGQMLGFDNQFGGDTASLLAGLDDNVVVGTWKAMAASFTGAYGEDSVGDVIFGPSINTFARGGDLLMGVYESGKALTARPSFEGLGEGLTRSANDFLSIASTWNNARKAVEFMRLREAFSKQGNVIIGEHNMDSMNFLTKVMAGLGIPSDMEQAYWGLKNSNREMSKYLSSRKQEIKGAMVRALKTGDFEIYRGLLLWHSAGMSDMEYKEMMDSIINDVMSDQLESELDKETRKYLDNLLRSGGRVPGQLEHMHARDFQERQQ